jgi:tetratricopeptide (TPR) repeat protein
MRTTRLLCALLLTLATATASVGAEPDRSSGAWEFMMARLAANEGNFDEALRLMDRVLKTDPDNPILVFEKASILLDAQKLQRGESELRKLVQNQPNFYDANRLLGRLLLDRSGGSPGRIEEALSYLRQAYRLMPDDLATGLTVAQIFVATERFDEAAQILATVVERAPDNRTANYTYSQVLGRLGRADEASEYLERAAAADPTFAPAVFQLVDIYQQQREWLKAAELLAPLIEQDSSNPDLRRQQAFFFLRAGEHAKAIPVLEDLIAADPRDTRARFFLAEAHAESGDLQKAEALYRALLEFDPNNVDYLVSFGLTQMANRDFDGAARTFETLMVLETASEGVRRLAGTQLAAIAHQRGDYDTALQNALPATGGERLNNQAINVALDVYKRREEWQSAIDLVEAQIARFGQEPYLLARKLEFLLYADRQEEASVVITALRGRERGALALAEVYVQVKEYDRAVDVLREVRETDPENIPVLFQLGAALERSGNVDESEKVFETLLSLEQEHAPTLNYLGYMWADRGVNLERSAEMIEKAVAADPRNGAYLDSLGWVYFRLGKLDLAEKYLLQAAEIVADDPTVQEHLGDLYSKLGQFDRALRHYRNALGLDPEPTDEEGLKVKIAQLESRN